MTNRGIEMKKGEKGKNFFDEIVKKAIVYLQDIQNSGERGRGVAHVLDDVALYLLEECQIPIEEVAKLFIYQRLKAFEIIAVRILDRVK